MARTWLSVTVELIGGRGEELWPWPGRILAVGPSHTFMSLASAINGAFGRWDRSHMSMFTLADDQVITDLLTGAEMMASAGLPFRATLDIESAKVGRVLELGAEFQFTFDLGDQWTHRCSVAKDKIDPVEELGVRPETPLPYWGWGTIPDQYGRRWAFDDGESPPPQRPSRPHPMLLGEWPTRANPPALDLRALRASIAANDPAQFLAVVRGSDADEALQQMGAGVAMVLRQRSDQAESMALSVIKRLTWRRGPGDLVLAEDLLARLRGEPLTGTVVPVDLDMLSMEMEGDGSWSSGGYIDLRTGEVYGESSTDATLVGEDAAIDVEEDPDRWLRFDSLGSRTGWRDMADFAEQQREAGLQRQLERAIRGTGAFRRFRDVVHEEGLAERWDAFCTDRQLGRARQFLADSGIRVG